MLIINYEQFSIDLLNPLYNIALKTDKVENIDIENIRNRMKNNKYALGNKDSEKLLSEKNLYRSFSNIHKFKLSQSNLNNKNSSIKTIFYDFSFNQIKILKKIASYLNVSNKTIIFNLVNYLLFY